MWQKWMCGRSARTKFGAVAERYALLAIVLIIAHRLGDWLGA